MEIVRTEDEINSLIQKCSEQQAKGASKFRGQTYEDGIRNAIDWITGESDDEPMAD